MLTIEQLKEKYSIDREEMTKEQEREFIKDMFDFYESEDFAKVFWSPYEFLNEDKKAQNYFGKPFTVIGRVTEKEADLECLPMWKIRFDDGFEISAYPEEIIPSEMKGNGCNLKII